MSLPWLLASVFMVIRTKKDDKAKMLNTVINIKCTDGIPCTVIDVAIEILTEQDAEKDYAIKFSLCMFYILSTECLVDDH